MGTVSLSGGVIPEYNGRDSSPERDAPQGFGDDRYRSITCYNRNMGARSLKKYVAVKRIIDGKFVEFNFAIGEPTLFVELILPVASYAEFCKANDVIEMSSDERAQVDAEAAKWRYGTDSD